MRISFSKYAILIGRVVYNAVTRAILNKIYCDP